MSAYGEALVEQTREHVSYRWSKDRGLGRMEIDVLRFPSVKVSAIMMCELVPNNTPTNLSKRELTILSMSASDSTDGEISRELKIARATVSRHKQNIRSKLEVREWAGAISKAIRCGLI